MNRSIEQALNSLIPRHPSPLPPELLELASSLLAQSRNRASNLKAEEEIGRTYACANIACERLKTTLNLSKIEPRPPCPPRVYSKLYAYFDRLLTSSSSTSRKRTKASSASSTPRKASVPERRTPGKERSLDGFRVNRIPKRGLRFGTNRERLPRWVGPAVRVLCQESKAMKAVPHVLAGVESVLFQPCPALEEEEGDIGAAKMEGKVPALVAAVWLFVKTRLIGEETDGSEYVRERKRVLGILGGVRADKDVLKKVGEGEEKWERWEDVGSGDVDAWLLEISQRGWLKMDWFENIIEGSGVGGTESEGDAEDEDQEGQTLSTDRGGKEAIRPGLGSMMQDKFDYLSEAKREEYAEWKGMILARVDALTAEGVLDDDMDNTT